MTTLCQAAGPFVLPGNYQVKLTADGKEFTQPLTVRMDPRSVATPAELNQQFTWAQKALQIAQRSRQGYRRSHPARIAAARQSHSRRPRKPRPFAKRDFSGFGKRRPHAAFTSHRRVPGSESKARVTPQRSPPIAICAVGFLTELICIHLRRIHFVSLGRYNQVSVHMHERPALD